MKPFSRCVVVTPTFNSQAFLDDTIASVVLQSAPEVAIHYHIQDGGSTDGTEAIVRAWIDRVPTLPRMARSVRLTWASARDRGMYDAVNAGMAALVPAADDIVTWINSDDRLAPGAVATVAQVFADHPGCEFVSGRTALLNEAGSIVSITYPQAYPRQQLAAGAHDGRAQAFIMQEGTFFTGRLWAAVGGVDPSFRLAGDWDLWRRMAQEAAHSSIDTVTAFHRRRAGQLSGDMASYHAEVDARAGEAASPPVPQTPPQLIRYDADAGRWISVPFDTLASRPPIAITDGRRRPSCAITYLGGFGAPEGPYPEHRLPSAVRWLREPSAEIAVEAPYDGAYRLTLTMRPTSADLRLRLFCNGLALAETPLAPPVPDTDQLVAVPVWLGIGRSVIELEIVGGPDEPRVLLLVGCTIVAEADREVEAPLEPPVPTGELLRAVKGMAVMVTAGDDPTALAETIASVREAAGPGLLVRVAPDTDAAGVVEALVPYARRIARAEDELDERLRRDGFRTVMEIAAGETLRPAALIAAHRALREAGTGAVAGLVDRLDGAGAVVSRWLPDPSRPILRDLTGAGATVSLPLAIVARRGEVSAPVAPPERRVAVIDHRGDGSPTGPLFALAGALRSLGVEARYLVGVEPDAGETVIAAPEAFAGTADFTASAINGDLHLRPCGEGAAITLPAALDAQAFRPRALGPARAALELPADAFLVLADPERIEAARAALPAGAQLAAFGGSGADGVIALPRLADPDTVAHLISAFDAVVATGSWLTRAALACGVPTFDADGTFAGSDEAGPGLAALLRRLSLNRALARIQSADARAAIERGATVDALAVALHERVPGFSGEGKHLAAGAIAVPTNVSVALEPAVPQHRGFALYPLRGAAVEGDPDWSNVLRLEAAEAVLLLRLEDLSGTALRLHVAAPEGGSWSIQVDDGPAAPLHLSQPVTTARVAAPLPHGLHRVTLRAVNPRARADVAATRIVAWEVVSTRASPPREAERTRLVPVPLAGRQVAALARDGDWQPVEGFLKPEEPHPAAGLHTPFRWTHGDHASFRLRCDRGGTRAIDLAVTAIASGQRLRLVVGDVATEWSAPMLAYVGRVSHVRWTLDWPVGDVDVRLDLTDRPGTGNPRDLGVLILGMTLS